jgi:hypothetical protein
MAACAITRFEVGISITIEQLVHSDTLHSVEIAAKLLC